MGLVAWIGRSLAAERERWALWIPVLLGAGIGVYFALPAEPPLWCIALPAPALLAALALRRRPAAAVAALAAALVLAGFAVAALRTATVAAPVLEQRTGPVRVEGRVLQVERRDEARRLTLAAPAVGRLAASGTPARVRVTVRGWDGAEPRPGDVVRLRAILLPPPAPAAPGAFDFARLAYFERLGAVGFALGPARVVAETAPGWRERIERLRQTITGRVLAALDGPEGGVAAALITGERGAIPQEVLDAFRDSGLAHLLAISGLHLGMVAGLLFFAVRLGLAACESVALRRPIKKWAAVAALLGGFFYLLIAGATVPTQRAFLMTGLVLIGIVADRDPISLRLVAWAAGAILLMAPESLLGASFQLSFAAVVALVAVYEAAGPALARLRSRDGGLPRVTVFLAGLVLTAAVANLATAPIAAYHFNRVVLYGLFANLVAVPLTGLWIMPCAAAALLLMPLGLEGIALAPMGWGLSLLLDIAGRAAALPGAVQPVAAAPTAALVAVVAGGLWLCLWRTPWRRLGLAAIAGGLVLAAQAHPPDLLVDARGGLIGLRAADGGLVLSARRTDGFVGDTWRRLIGAGEARAGTAPRDGVACDTLGCVWHAFGRTIAVPERRGALLDDCARAEIVVSRLWIKPWRCRGPSVVIDGWRLRHDGAHALWLDEGAIRVESVAGRRGRRPWTGAPQ